ncbi:MAG: hypothetical protein HY255_07385 [Betaproteobacteria bacterium]|nr:hypothetical protein [Betaproteobacteria bacterium]
MPSTLDAAKFLAAFCCSVLLVTAAAQGLVRETAPPAKPAPAPAAFGNIGNQPAVVYDAPSAKAVKTYLFGPRRAVEILVKLDKMCKVRDADGTVGWVESGAMGNVRYVEVSAASADIRAAASASAALAFDAGKGVSLEVIGAAADGWLPVKHRDGQAGYVRVSQVFGE